MIRFREVCLWAAVSIWCVLAAWPASWWYEAGGMAIPPHRQGDDFQLLYTGGPVRTFTGSYSVVMRDANTGLLVAEEGSAPFTYRVGSKRPDPLRISWWAPKAHEAMRNVPPGTYTLETCWTIHRPLLVAPNKTTCTGPVLFEVSE